MDGAEAHSVCAIALKTVVWIRARENIIPDLDPSSSGSEMSLK
jgi:hypothetical protein